MIIMSIATIIQIQLIPNCSSQTKELLWQLTNRTPILMITIIIIDMNSRCEHRLAQCPNKTSGINLTISSINPLRPSPHGLLATRFYLAIVFYLAIMSLSFGTPQHFSVVGSQLF